MASNGGYIYVAIVAAACLRQSQSPHGTAAAPGRLAAQGGRCCDVQRGFVPRRRHRRPRAALGRCDFAPRLANPHRMRRRRPRSARRTGVTALRVWRPAGSAQTVARLRLPAASHTAAQFQFGQGMRRRQPAGRSWRRPRCTSSTTSDRPGNGPPHGLGEYRAALETPETVTTDDTNYGPTTSRRFGVGSRDAKESPATRKPSGGSDPADTGARTPARLPAGGLRRRRDRSGRRGSERVSENPRRCSACEGGVCFRQPAEDQLVELAERHLPAQQPSTRRFDRRSA